MWKREDDRPISGANVGNNKQDELYFVFDTIIGRVGEASKGEQSNNTIIHSYGEFVCHKFLSHPNSGMR